MSPPKPSQPAEIPPQPGHPDHEVYEHFVKLTQIYFSSHGFIVPEVNVARTDQGDVVRFMIPAKSKLVVPSVVVPALRS